MPKRRPARGMHGRAESPVISPILPKASKRRALLASTAFMGAFIAVIAGNPQSALAACAITVSPNTVTCDTTTTTATPNTDAATASSSDRLQIFSAGSVVAIVNAGQTVSGAGLAISPNQAGAAITFINNGAVTTNQAENGLVLQANGGTITYSGNGSASNTTNNGVGLLITTTGDIMVGASGTPVTPNFLGTSGLQTLTSTGQTTVQLSGGTITATDIGGNGMNLAAVGSGGISATLTGNTTITNASGGANATTGIDVSTAGAITIASDANIGTAGAATSFSTGINASASGAGNIAVTQTGGTIFATSAGIHGSHSGAGAITVNTAAGSAITMNGAGTGIDASTTGTGGVNVTHAGAISGATTGISARISNAANASNVVVTNNGSITTATNGTGIDAATNGTGSVTVTGSGSVNAGLGISAIGTGGGNVTVTGSGNITAAGHGIRALASGGNGNVVVAHDGVISAGGIGVLASAVGTGTSTVTISRDVTSAVANGVLAVTQGGTNTVTVTGGTVRANLPGEHAIQAGSTTGAINITIGAAAAVDTWNNGGGAGVFASSTSGNATVTNSGTIVGTIGVSTSTNGVSTVINAGSITGFAGIALQFFSGVSNNLFVMSGPSAALTGNAIGAGSDTFRFAGSGANSFNAAQIGTGWTLIDKTEASNWTLTGTSTTTAAVAVNGGTLSVNGDLSSTSSVTVNAGGTLGGTGILPSVTINAGGSLAPGNSIGTITVGSLAIAGAGNYVVEVSPVAADRTNVTGNATLAGTLRAIGTGGSYTIGQKYTVMNVAGILAGSFDSLAISGNFGVTRPHVEYDLNNVYLVLDQGLVSPFLVNGTANQRAVAGAVDAALLGGNAAAPFPALIGLTSPQLNGALDQLSGEVHASTAGALVDESSYMRAAILGRLRQASYGGDASMAALSLGGPQTSFADEALESALAYAKSPIVTKAPVKAPRATSDIVFWSQGFGAWGRFNGDGNAAALNRDLAGFITGFDARFGSWRGGLAAGYTGSRNNTDGRGSANVESGHVAAYGGTNLGAFNLRAGGAFAWHTIDTDRMIAFPGFFDRATAHYEGRTGQIFGEAGYGLAFGKVAVEPFAGAAWVHLDTDAASERAATAGLNIAATTFEVGYSTLGVRAASLVPLDNGMVLIPRASAAWQHAYGSVTPAAALAFQVAPANTFIVSGVPIARDAALAEAGLDLAINAHATVGVSYTGQLAGNVSDHAAKGKFSWKF